MTTRKRVYDVLFIIDSIFLLSFIFSDKLLSSNLSRVFNSDLKAYFLLNLFSFSYGINLFLVCEKRKLHRIKYLALTAPLIASVIRYNPLFPNALSSNMHLLSAYVSCIMIAVIELIILFRYNLNLKMRRFLINVYIIVFAFCLYLYIDHMFVNLLNEIIYLEAIELINLIIMHYEVKK